MLHALVPKLAQLLGSVGSPARTLSILNACAARVLPIDRFVTAAVLELDAEHHSLTIANAGHVPVLVRSLGGTVACLGRASGPPLGVVANALYLDETTPLQRGDVVVLMPPLTITSEELHRIVHALDGALDEVTVPDLGAS